jgi:hypothetical protein
VKFFAFEKVSTEQISSLLLAVMLIQHEWYIRINLCQNPYFAPNTESHLFSLIVHHAGLNPFKPFEGMSIHEFLILLFAHTHTHKKKAGAYKTTGYARTIGY